MNSRISVSATLPAGSVVAETKSENLAAGGSFSTPTNKNMTYETQSTGGAITSSNTPFGIVAPPDDTEITVVGLSDVNTVTIPFADVNYGCLIDGDFLAKNGTNMRFKWNKTKLRYLGQGGTQLLV
jgi:hypothetical protein